MMNKKWIRPQILFPAAIALTFAVVMCIAVLRPNPEDILRIEKTDKPGVMDMMWSSLEEEEFFKSMSIAVYATIEKEPEYFFMRFSPISDENDRTPMATYYFTVNEVLANARLRGKITNGREYRMSSCPSAFTDRSVKKGSYVLMLRDGRDMSTFEPENDPFGVEYETICFNAMGYYVITPWYSLFPAEPDGSVRSTKLPEYLRGEGEYTTLEELREILHAGREKYGIPTLE